MRTATVVLLGLPFLLLVPSPLMSAPQPDDLLAPARLRLEAAMVEATSLPPSLERARALHLSGEPDSAWALLEDGVEGDAGDIETLRLTLLLDRGRYLEAKPVFEEFLAAQPLPADPELRRLAYRWRFVTDDLPAVEEMIAGARAEGDPTVEDRLAEGNLRLSLLDYEGAGEIYASVLETATADEDLGRAHEGLGRVRYEEKEMDASLEEMTAALPLLGADPDLLFRLGRTLIRLGRTDDAIAAFELAVEANPYHEVSHYYLGNGYARKNYTQLYEAWPDAFASETGALSLAAADSLLAGGDEASALAAYRDLARLHPGWADVRSRLGSVSYGLGDFEEAKTHFQASLLACPEYGRAHNGLAKALEGERLAVEVHRPLYEERFAATEMPQVEGIEEFVVNWSSLTPRQQKQVALSMEPWERFIPVLIASGATYYIKPLYELLSETPGQETLRDQRISYDSRLWDDVRGCGGYHTVTGVEDVERTRMNRYNTVLHELAHQVHGVLPAPRKRQIEELYRQTKVREESGEDAFLSAYAGGSEWEYLAEGANALYSPRRDEYDTREIVEERLDERDPALRSLVLELMETADVESCFAVGYTNRGDDRLERGKVDEAVASYWEALERTQGEETATGSLVYALTLDGRAEEALDIATEAAARDPQSATFALGRSQALWHAGAGLDSALAVLAEARDAVRAEERRRIDLERGRLLWVEGDADASRDAYQAALEAQADDPSGLWGLAGAYALAGNWEEAWPRYDEAVRIRTGIVDLRTDYARDLLRAGEVARAREQVEAALLLDPEDPTALALEAWVLLEEGDAEAARRTATRAAEAAPWCDLALLVQARCLIAAGDLQGGEAVLAPIRERIATNAPPSFVYRPKWGRYDEVHQLPAVERTLVPGEE